MTKLGCRFETAIVGLALLTSASAGWCASSTVDYAGNVLVVDATTGNIVVGDMGPLQNDGRSEIARRSIVVTPSTEFTKVIRTQGVAPSGWIGDYVTTRVAPSEVKPGDFVAITASLEKDGPQALKITVVEVGER
jgi:acetyl-CoA acetyltransferase